MTVEGAWNTLKLFENEGIAPFRAALPSSKTMLRQETTATGQFLGFASGIERNLTNTKPTLDFLQARQELHHNLYVYMLKTFCRREIEELVAEYHRGKSIIIVEKNVLLNPETDHLSPSQNLVNGWILKEYLEEKLMK